MNPARQMHLLRSPFARSRLPSESDLPPKPPKWVNPSEYRDGYRFCIDVLGCSLPFREIFFGVFRRFDEPEGVLDAWLGGVMG